MNVCSRPEETSEVISRRFVELIARYKLAKFSDPLLNRSQEILLETVGCGIFASFFRENFRPEVVIEVISGFALERIGMDGLVKFCDSRSNHCRDIRTAHFVMDDERHRRTM